jgi:hypothetical protein
MTLDHPRMRPRCLPLVALVLGIIAWCAAKPAAAQLITADPYDPDQARYRGFVYPGYVSDPYLGGRALFMGGPAGANQMQNYYRGVEGGLTDPRRGGRFSRFDSSYRQSDEIAGRSYQPNADVDEAYYADKEERDAVYFKASREKDPRKKAELMKEYQTLNQKLTRDAAPNRARNAAAARSKTDRSDAAPGTARRGGSSAPPVPGLAPREPGSKPSTRPRAARATRSVPELPILEVLGQANASARENSTSQPSSGGANDKPPNPTDTLRRAQSDARSAAPPVPNLRSESPRPR